MEKGFILIGFNKDKLIDIIGEEETLMKHLIKQTPPVWRAFEACSEKQVQAFLDYQYWIKSLMEME